VSESWIALGSIKQKGGKIVHAWALEDDLPSDFELRSNEFEIEWPPRSGKRSRFPEVDDARFFSTAEAREKIKAAQFPLIERLLAHLEQTPQ
jgi:predicted NUDIX family NTP pyrophosphohydrolase